MSDLALEYAIRVTVHRNATALVSRGIDFKEEEINLVVEGLLFREVELRKAECGRLPMTAIERAKTTEGIMRRLKAERPEVIEAMGRFCDALATVDGGLHEILGRRAARP